MTQLEENEADELDGFWDYSRPDESERRFRELMDQSARNHGAGYRIELLTQLARSQGLQGEFEPAHATLDEAERLLTPELKRARVRYLLERGRVFNSSGKRDQATPHFLQAWELAREAGEDGYAVDAAHMMGIVEPPEKQLEWDHIAIELAQSSSDPRANRWVPSLYNNLGWTYAEMGNYAEAMEQFRKELALREAGTDIHAALITRYSITCMLRRLGRIDEALASAQALRTARDERGEEAPYVNEELGECLYALSRPVEAAPYFARAYAALSNDHWLAQAEPERLARLKELGSLA